MQSDQNSEKPEARKQADASERAATKREEPAGQPGIRTGGSREALFTGGAALQQREARSWKPLGIAGGVVLVVVALLLLAGRHARQAANPGGPGLAPAAAYAGSLAITDVQMSDSTNLSGGKETYLDGNITNRGTQTVHGITVQVAFRDFNGQMTGKETQPLYLIHFRQPYIDTELVGAEPIKPGQSRQFRLIFDATPATWDGAYPTVRIINVDAR